MSIYDNLKELNISIHNPPDPVGSYVAFKKITNLLYISGQTSMDDKGKITKGKLGKDLSVEEGMKASRLCAINIIAQANKAC